MKYATSRKVVLFAAFAFAASCGLKQEVKEEYPVKDFADTPLAGKVHAKDWVMKSGHAKRSTTSEGISLSFKSDENDKGCDGIMRGLDDINVGITVEEKLGEQEIRGADAPASISVGAEVTTIVGNKIDISEISESAVLGRLSMYSSDDLFVNGTFTILRCF